MDKNDVISLIKEHNVQYIRLMFADLLGNLKNVEVPSTQIEKILDNKITFDGSSIEGFVRILESDMRLHPDVNSFKIFEWEKITEGKVAGLFCDVYSPDGTPFVGDTRAVLKRAIAKMKEAGFNSFNIGLEPEFYLLKEDSSSNISLEVTDTGGYFDLAPVDLAVDCRRDIIFELIRAKFDIEAGHHEVGPGQHEINFKYADALESSDNLMLFKLIVKNVARRHGMYATFMPKIKSKIAGSGMHTNMSLSNKDGSNAFYDPNGNLELSKTAFSFIGGIMNHVLEFCSVTNPTVNSYKRLVPGYEAPCYVAYSDSNRSALVRIPASKEASTRCELRMVDPSCNPYLALACILAAGLDGIAKNIPVSNPVREDIFAMTNEERASLGINNLPDNLRDAISITEKSTFVKDVLGEFIHKKFLYAKSLEWDDYRTTVHDWEIERYLSSI